MVLVMAGVGFGGYLLFFCVVLYFVYNDWCVSGFSVVYRLSGHNFGFAAGGVVSAAAPWVYDLR
jgi:hypothetical protein